MDIQIPYLNFAALLPLLIVVVTGIIVMIADLFIADKRSLGWVSLIGVLLAAAVGAMQQGMPGFDPAFQNMAVTDGYAHFFNLIFLSAAALSILVALGYLGRVGLQKGEYYALLLFSIAGMMMMAAATDLILIFLGLETMSMALYVMAAFNRNQRASGEAGIKYFLMGSFASAFFLYGAALLYGATGSANLSVIGGVLGGGGNPIALLGLGLLLIGFAFKIAAVPFHWWTPDVYTGSPTSVTAFMSVGAKAAGFAALLRLLMVSFPPPTLAGDWQAAIAVLAVLTMTLGNIAALAQKDVKRMLAYSSIAHAGYILLGVAAGSAAGISAALFYLLAYTFMNIGAFAVIGALERQGAVGSNPSATLRTGIKDYAGLASRNVWLALGMAIFLLSLTGFPPLAGFWGKLYLFRAAVQSNLTWLAVIGVLNSGIAAYYYLNVIVQMYMKPVSDEAPAINLNLVTQVALGVAALFTVIVGLWPSPVIEMTLRSLFG
ncbi:MAG TPA: NADH-quinone oxidoreductase subunit N [Chloroflexi bacterium]|nr:NADH-quinone oxidoreductase subunit N [Chloroflexota bacterium]